uniref:Uncharacterized protein n=1 Tax=Cannabis sativa TaxID=3483 RepID=A0A803QF47_CANSA
MEKSGVMMMMICIVVVGLVFVPSPISAISSSDQDHIMMNGQDKKMVTIMDRDTLFEFLDEVTLELEADFEINDEVARSGVLAKSFGCLRFLKEESNRFWENSFAIGDKVGTFIKSDGAANGVIALRGYLKLKVDILIDQQLPAGFFLSIITRGRWEWIQFKYIGNFPPFASTVATWATKGVDARSKGHMHSLPRRFSRTMARNLRLRRDRQN